MLKIAAVIPTRGDVDRTAILAKLRSYPEIDDVCFVVGDTPFNRYVHMSTLEEYSWFYTQDDDCITDLRPLIDGMEKLIERPANTIINAMTPEHAAHYPNRQTLIGFGAIFHKDALNCFTDYPWTHDALFRRESDRIFATVNPHVTVFPKIQILECAHAPNRLWKQPDHNDARRAMEQRILEVTGIAA